MTAPRSRWLLAAAILLTALALQLFQGAYLTSFSSHPDEPAHFVTGAMVHDYLFHALGSPPVPFAKAYYLRYPKVAFGHWPPGFYALQALWYGLFGISVTSAMLLVGAIVAATAFVLGLRLIQLHGTAIGLATAAVFISLPLVRESLALFLSDMLAALFTLIALLAFCDATAPGGRSRRAWIWFATATAAAILTKESALWLVGFAVAGMVLGRASLRMRPRTLLAAVVAATGLLALVYSAGGVLEGRGLPRLNLPADLHRIPGYLATFLDATPLLLFPFAALGVLALRSPASPRTRHARAALLAIPLCLGAQLAFRDMVEPRYFLPLLFPLLLLFAEGLRQITGVLAPARLRLPAPVVTLAVTLAVVISTTRPTEPPILGYREAATAVLRMSSTSATLIASNATGEGAFIAESLLHDPARSSYVLRATKLLASMDWVGRGYQLNVPTTPELIALLNAIPVRYVVIDSFALLHGPILPHFRLLQAAIDSAPQQFPLLTTLPLTSAAAGRWPAAIAIYENVSARGRAPQPVPTRISTDRGDTIRPAPATHWPFPTGTPPPVTSAPHLLERVTLLLAPHLASPQLAAIRHWPESDSLESAGGRGIVLVSAPDHLHWTAAVAEPAPGHSWITLQTPVPAKGSAALHYTVQPHESNHRRQAQLIVAGRPFPIHQAPPDTIRIPFIEDFSVQPFRWVLEDHNGVARVDADAGGPSLQLSNRKAGARPFQTQLQLTSLALEQGRSYQVTLRLKADRPATIDVSLNQRRAPFGPCGLHRTVPVTTEWTVLSLQSEPIPAGCGPESNRLSISAGTLEGRLWLAEASLTLAAGQSAAEPTSNRRPAPVSP